MSPSRRSSTAYRPKRDRREVTIAVATGVAIVLFTVLMVWILGPHDSGGSDTPSTTTSPSAATTTAPAGGSTTPTSNGTASTAPTSSTPSSSGAPTTTAPAGGG